MHEEWVAYTVVFSVVALMLLGKRLMFFDINKKDKNKDD